MISLRNYLARKVLQAKTSSYIIIMTMKTKTTVEEILEYTESLGGTHDNPFSDDEETSVLRNGESGKWFGIILRVPAYFYGGDEAEVCLNLKCLPDVSYLLREEYENIRPAYHMNKEHWITVRLDGSVPDETIKQIMILSYELVDKKRRKK